MSGSPTLTPQSLLTHASGSSSSTAATAAQWAWWSPWPTPAGCAIGETRSAPGRFHIEARRGRGCGHQWLGVTGLIRESILMLLS